MTNISAFDVWTPVHAMSGYTLAIMGVTAPTFAIVSVLYEVIENWIERQPNNPFSTTAPERLVNVIADLAVQTAAYAATRAAMKGSWTARF